MSKQQVFEESEPFWKVTPYDQLVDRFAIVSGAPRLTALANLSSAKSRLGLTLLGWTLILCSGRCQLNAHGMARAG